MGIQKKQTYEEQLVSLQANMMSFALRLTADKDAAMDLMQETSLKVLDNMGKYRENVNFKGWVMTIMHNIFINNYRRTVRDQLLIDTNCSTYLLNIPQDQHFSSPEKRFSEGEITAAIFNNFAIRYRVPFLMYVSGYKYEEIAHELRLPTGTIKSRIFYIRKRLQSILSDYHYN
ncbi:MAG: RNA polymerase sigma factor [Dysgonomonas sp.]|nr:RNA polymerase sigma factor [Dysgonomonas sp.]